VLEKVCEYLYYYQKWSNQSVGNRAIPKFDVPLEMLPELLMAAHFLEC